MIRCLKCGTKNKKDAKFCANCGETLENANQVAKKKSKKGNDALAIVLVVCLLLGGGYFAYSKFSGKPSLNVSRELSLVKNKTKTSHHQKKDNELAKAKSENESLKKEKRQTRIVRQQAVRQVKLLLAEKLFHQLLSPIMILS